MNWQEILTIIVPIFALMGWVYARIEKKAEGREQKAEERLNTLLRRLEVIETKIDNLNMRPGTEDKK